MARKEPTPATLKALFAKSGNRCAYPNCNNPLVDDLNIFVGEVCHINAVEKKDARYVAVMTDDELRHFGNLVLLCHAHHRRVDTREDLYPANALRQMKRDHEIRYEPTHFAADESVLFQAVSQIIQKDWAPDLSRAVELLYETLAADQHMRLTQGRMNSVAASVATVTDAQLLVVYTRLFQTLSPAGQVVLFREQEAWVDQRHAYVEREGSSYGGTMARGIRNELFSEFTRLRIDELKRRIPET